MGAWLNANDFSNITFFGQDWGGLIGLRMIVNDADRFDRVVISNTGLPYNPDVPGSVVKEVENFRANAPTPSLAEMQKNISSMDSNGHPAQRFAYWQKWCWENEDMPIGFIMSMMMERPSKPMQVLKFLLHKLGVVSPLPSPLAKAYEAPFPDASYKMGPRAMPSQVPTLPTSPSLEEQRKAWEFFDAFNKPFLCAFADNDPVTRAMEPVFKKRVPGAQGQPHRTIKKGGHFVQENAPDQVAQAIIDLIRPS
jgi:haloalkane dehalogenase